MLHGTEVALRPMRESDLDAVYAAQVEIQNRGAFFPLGVRSEPAFRRAFALALTRTRLSRLVTELAPWSGPRI